MSTAIKTSCILGLFVLAACSEQKAPIMPDSSVAKYRDSSTTKSKILVDIRSLHLVTNRKSDQQVKANVTHAGFMPNEALGHLKKAFSMVSIPGKKNVTGTWSIQFPSGSSSVMIFTPSSPLAKDTDYLVQIAKSGNILPITEKALFRVGSLPRVRSIRFNKTTAGKNDASKLHDLSITFSEQVSAAKAFAAMAVKKTADSKSLAIKMGTSGYYAVELLFDGKYQTDKEIEISIGNDVGAATGKKLDGKYNSQEASGPQKIKLKPSDFISNTAKKDWEPSLSL